MKPHIFRVEVQQRDVRGLRGWSPVRWEPTDSTPAKAARRALAEYTDGRIWRITLVPMVLSARVRWHDGRRWHTSPWRKVKPRWRLAYRHEALEACRALKLLP